MVYMITCKEDGTKFYFYTLADVNAFLYVFKDHWCNISWEGPEEISINEVPKDRIMKMKKNPKERAESNLSWGFNLAKMCGKDINDEQIAFIGNFINNITEEDK